MKVHIICITAPLPNSLKCKKNYFVMSGVFFILLCQGCLLFCYVRGVFHLFSSRRDGCWTRCKGTLTFYALKIKTKTTFFYINELNSIFKKTVNGHLIQRSNGPKRDSRANGKRQIFDKPSNGLFILLC